MKTTMLTIIALTLAVWIFWGCESSPTSSEKSSLQINNDEVVLLSSKSDFDFSEYDQIGIIHNSGLDYIYDKLLLLKTQNTSSKTSDPWWVSEPELFAAITQYGNEYLSLNLPVGADSDIASQMFGRGLKGEWVDPNYVKSLVDNSDLSETYKFYLNEISSIHLNEQTNLGQAISKLKQIRNEIRKNVQNEQDQYYLISQVTITLYSLDYWKKNADKWVDLFGLTEAPVFLSTVEADFWGAVGGFIIGGSITWNLGGAIGGAIGGCIATSVCVAYGWSLW